METFIVTLVVVLAAVQVVRLYVPRRWLRLIGAGLSGSHDANGAPVAIQTSTSAGCGSGCSACNACDNPIAIRTQDSPSD